MSSNLKIPLKHIPLIFSLYLPMDSYKAKCFHDFKLAKALFDDIESLLKKKACEASSLGLGSNHIFRELCKFTEGFCFLNRMFARIGNNEHFLFANPVDTINEHALSLLHMEEDADVIQSELQRLNIFIDDDLDDSDEDFTIDLTENCTDNEDYSDDDSSDDPDTLHSCKGCVMSLVPGTGLVSAAA